MKVASAVTTYVIEYEKFNLKMLILSIKKVRPHEKTVPTLVNLIAENIIKDGRLRHPVIVDEKSLTVLDGTHRVAALARIGCDKVPACLVDYGNPSIAVGRWYRAIEGMESTMQILPILKELKLKHEEASYRENVENEFKNDLAAAIIDRKDVVLVYGAESNVKKAYEIVASIEDEVKKRGFNITYENEFDGKRKLEEGEIDVLMVPPQVHKSQVVMSGLSGNLLPRKATRHIVPARPLGVNVPIKMLVAKNMTLKEANIEFLKILSKKKIRRMPPSSLIGSRKYEEEVFLFEQ